MTVKLPPLAEAEFQRQVIDLAHILGWRVAHFRPAMTAHGWRTPVQADGKGFPDLVMVRRDRLIFAELKAEKRKLTPEQVEWFNALTAVAEVYVWHPADIEALASTLR